MRYHPNHEIDAEVHSDLLAAEAVDLAAGYPPSKWTCECGASHSRGTINGVAHRCLRCGFVGVGGTIEPTIKGGK